MRWRDVAAARFLHLSCVSASAEDAGTAASLEDCASQAGLQTAAIDMNAIGLGEDVFVDHSGREVELLFEPYPREWMFADPFGHAAAVRRARFVEPPWKAQPSSKGAPALLWEMAPGRLN